MADWIEHDGTCCPVPVGTWCEYRRRDQSTGARRIHAHDHSFEPFMHNGYLCHSSWFWDIPPGFKGADMQNCIIAYRIPSSKHIEALRRIAENVRETENA